MISLALFLVVAQPAAPAPGEAERILVLDLTHNGVDENDVKVITTAVAEAAARAVPAANVVTSADLRTLSSLAAEQQECGIDSVACLAELAGAMDVKRVVHGTVSRLSEGSEQSEILVQLRIFDAATASAGQRVSWRAKTLSTALDATPANVNALFGDGEARANDGSAGLSPVWGGVALGAGALAAAGTAIVGGMYNATLTDLDSSRAQKDDALSTGRIVVVAGSVVAVGLGATGAVMLATAEWE